MKTVKQLEVEEKRKQTTEMIRRRSRYCGHVPRMWTMITLLKKKKKKEEMMGKMDENM